jgi:uncharacterized membrane protein YvbJ
MVNSIYAILLTNVNDRRHNDNDDNDNAIKYLESNKDNSLDLAEKNYENLVEALTDNAIATVATSISSVLQASSTFLGPYPQTYIHRIEEPENFHNSEGDIAE